MNFSRLCRAIHPHRSALEILGSPTIPRHDRPSIRFIFFRGLAPSNRLPPPRRAVASTCQRPPRNRTRLQQDADRVWPATAILTFRYLELLRKAFHGWLSLELFREELWRAIPLQSHGSVSKKCVPAVEAYPSGTNGHYQNGCFRRWFNSRSISRRATKRSLPRRSEFGGFDILEAGTPLIVGRARV